MTKSVSVPGPTEVLFTSLGVAYNGGDYHTCSNDPDFNMDQTAIQTFHSMYNNSHGCIISFWSGYNQKSFNNFCTKEAKYNMTVGKCACIQLTSDTFRLGSQMTVLQIKQF